MAQESKRINHKKASPDTGEAFCCFRLRARLLIHQALHHGAFLSVDADGVDADGQGAQVSHRAGGVAGERREVAAAGGQQ
jgi:hypothetical protein